MGYKQLDQRHLAVQPLSLRQSKTAFEEIRIDPDDDPPDAAENAQTINGIADQIHRARAGGSAVMLAYGAHLVKNGLAPVITRLMEEGWITHLSTNGAGIIHDWEFAFLGKSEEDVRANVATGTFGVWDETGRYIHLAALAGCAKNMGLGESMGRFICDDGCTLPAKAELGAHIEQWSKAPSDDPAMPAKSELRRQWCGSTCPTVSCRSTIPTRNSRFLQTLSA